MECLKKAISFLHILFSEAFAHEYFLVQIPSARKLGLETLFKITRVGRNLSYTCACNLLIGQTVRDFLLFVTTSYCKMWNNPAEFVRFFNCIIVGSSLKVDSYYPLLHNHDDDFIKLLWPGLINEKMCMVIMIYC